MSKITLVRSLFALAIPFALLGVACGPAGEEGGDPAVSDPAASDNEELGESEQALCPAPGPAVDFTQAGGCAGKWISQPYHEVPDGDSTTTCTGRVSVQYQSFPSACIPSGTILSWVRPYSGSLTPVQCDKGYIAMSAYGQTSTGWTNLGSLYAPTTWDPVALVCEYPDFLFSYNPTAYLGFRVNAALTVNAAAVDTVLFTEELLAAHRPRPRSQVRLVARPVPGDRGALV